MLFLQHFADHFLAVDPHGEVGDRGAARDGKRVERLDGPILGVDEHLRDFGDGDAVVDGDVDGLLLDLQRPAKAAVGNEQAGGLARGIANISELSAKSATMNLNGELAECMRGSLRRVAAVSRSGITQTATCLPTLT